ncbi:MAG: hypothetical protein A3D75_00690 [Candidatus Levybacteria bacterium RIFCSPHIGHO2_02_FULL_37_18]|nr:MAG: hypothetical protein A3D75_00690 [Candidatus Levybacteria bacterium RIFCSPHIGHO2_02_FULL_37_18]
MAKIFLLVIFFISVSAMLAFSLLYLAVTEYSKNPKSSQSLSFNNHVSFAAIPTTGGLIEHSITEADSRVEAVRDFFALYGSPLTQYAQNIIDAADTYGIDYKLLPAIAMQESNVCKKIISGSYNCWGFGIYGKKITKFESYPQAIDTVSKTLAHQYKNKGLQTPSEIQTKYNPSNTGDWAGGVLHFIEKIKFNP